MNDPKTTLYWNNVKMMTAFVVSIVNFFAFINRLINSAVIPNQPDPTPLWGYALMVVIEILAIAYLKTRYELNSSY